MQSIESDRGNLRHRGDGNPLLHFQALHFAKGCHASQRPLLRMATPMSRNPYDMVKGKSVPQAWWCWQTSPGANLKRECSKRCVATYTTAQYNAIRVHLDQLSRHGLVTRVSNL